MDEPSGLSRPVRAEPVDLLSDDIGFDQLPRGARNARRKKRDVRMDSDSNMVAQGQDVEAINNQLRKNTFQRLANYFKRHDEVEEWLRLPDIPTEFEVASISQDRSFVEQKVVLHENRLKDPYESVEQYLETQYRLMREDTISTLREAVEDMTPSPCQMEGQSLKKIRIYNRVYITGFTVASEGLAHRLEFHTDRVEKKIAWSQSKRLKAGTLIAMSPAEPKSEVFRNCCMIGIVAGRPLSDLERDDPSVEVFFGDTNTMELDPQIEYMMIEASNGYFEAVRHTLLALQHMRREKFPLSEYLVAGQTNVDITQTLKENPSVEIGSALVGEPSVATDIFDCWPDVHYIETPGPGNTLPTELRPGSLATTLDESQFAAYRRILTKQLAIVQGPPGTGKTHVSVIALKTLLANRKPGDPPIIVTAQTNHALDQLLRHIAPYAPEFIRLGGRTQDQEIIEPRTLHQVKQKSKSIHKDLRNQRSLAWKSLEKIAQSIKDVLMPLMADEPIHPDVFFKAGLITESQHTSLIEARSDWAGDGEASDGSPISRWSNGDVQPFKKADPERNLSEIAREDDDEDLYQMKDVELETGVVEDDDKERLFGIQISLNPGFSGGWNEVSRKSEAALVKYQDLSKLPSIRRGPVYNHLQRKLKEKLLLRFRELAAQAKRAAIQLKIARAQFDAALLRDAPIIGMTTTGLSKYRGLLSVCDPKIVLIEEAAETQEAYVTAACFETLEHLILVGDHLQLRAHCQNSALEGWNLHISLFERLVEYRGIEFQRLKTQRRMLPEMRTVMNVIYPDLQDHPCVRGRDEIPGMDGNNSWFMHHTTAESADEQFSWINHEEAELVAGLYEFLTRNGTPSLNITILTFYKGQQRQIRKCLRRNLAQRAVKVNVSTVDAYQGEENEIIILSLVRNNARDSIGFLSILNRVCVAMSRARRGFYIFGNSRLLVENSKDWKRMLKILRNRQQLAVYLPIICSRHGKRIEVRGSSSWTTCDGGCDQLCHESLDCGHVCPLYCHPEAHDELPCMQACLRTLPCGHACSAKCCDDCACTTCSENAKRFRRKHIESTADSEVYGDASGDDVADALSHGVETRTRLPQDTSHCSERLDSRLVDRGRRTNRNLRALSSLEKQGGYRAPLNDWDTSTTSSQAEMLIELAETTQYDFCESPAQTMPSTSPSLPPSPDWSGHPSVSIYREKFEKRQIDARPSGLQRQSAITAYQAFAQGGVQEDDRRRADDNFDAYAKAVGKMKQTNLDNLGTVTLGGAVPMQLASRQKKGTSPPKGNLPKQSAHNQSFPSLSNASTLLQCPDPFIDADESRFGPHAAGSPTLPVINAHLDHPEDLLISFANEGESKLREIPNVQNSGQKPVLGSNSELERELWQAQVQERPRNSSSPPGSARKKFVHKWKPIYLSDTDEQATKTSRSS